LAIAATVFFCAHSAVAQLNSTLYVQDFDGLSLMDSVNERLGPTITTVVESTPDTTSIPNAFTHTGPAGWTVNNGLDMYNGAMTVGNSGVPGQGISDYGVDEWEGWSFADIAFWASVDDQNRSMFNSANGGNASGVVAVVDADEYFDLGDPDNPTNGGFYNSGLASPSIGVSSGTLYTLSFDSSWRDEAFDDDHPNMAFGSMNNQAVEIIAQFDDPGMTATRIIGWNSDAASGEFKDDAPNERLDFNFGVPAGASNVQLHFNMANAGNDWWWAVDNLDVSEFMGSSVYDEDFEGVTLGGSVNERQAFAKTTVAEGTAGTDARPNSFTDQLPADWSVDNSGLPAGSVGRDDMGVYEWEGWRVASHEFWTFADLQRREEFTKCVGNCVIADSDEWDDVGSQTGPLDTLLLTPVLDISSVAPGELALMFDSSWRDEGDQTARIQVDYMDGNGPQTVMLWESQAEIDDGMAGMMPNPSFHDDATNETVLLQLDNPAGATQAQFSFALLNSDNNWWWAVDNVRIGSVPEPTSAALILLAMLGVAGLRGRRGLG
jgi:hypothetical protein